jgi:hypothetical protein
VGWRVSKRGMGVPVSWREVGSDDEYSMFNVSAEWELTLAAVYLWVSLVVCFVFLLLMFDSFSYYLLFPLLVPLDLVRSFVPFLSFLRLL